MKKCVLGEFADLIPGVSYTPDGIASSGVRILRGGNIHSSELQLKEDDVILSESYQCKDNEVHEGDTIVVASSGSADAFGKAATSWVDLPGVQIGAFLRIVRPRKREYAALVSAWVTQPIFQRYIGSVAKGTGINNIRKEYIEEYPINVDAFGLSQFSELYESICKKIALNRKRIATLEAMAKEIYDYWFVQFDFPDAHGRPYKSSGGAMVYNPDLKREIPKGWEVKPLGGIMQIERNTIDPSTIPDQEIEHYSIPAFDENMYPAVCRASEIQSSKFKIDSEVVLLSKLNPKFKRIWDPPVIGDHSLCSTEFIVCKAKQLRDKPFIFEVLNSDSVQRYMIDGASSSTGSRSRFAAELLLDFPLAIPPQSVMDTFTQVARLSHTQIKSLRIDITNMTALRDFLLPLLMNAQVKIGDVE